MADFDWQTEEEEAAAWEENPAVVQREPAKRSYRWLYGLLALLLLVGAGAFLIYRETTERIETATSDTASEVITAHQLTLTAVEDKDIDLLRSLVSGRDRAWVAQQFQAIRRGRFMHRVLFDQIDQVELPAIADIDEAAITVELSDDFRTAFVTYPVSYTLQTGEQMLETVTLGQTAVYKQGTSHWLYAPFEREAWGTREVIDFSRLSISVPARDVEIARTVGEPINDYLETLCTDPAYTCAADWQLIVKFETDPGIWETMDAHTYLYTPHTPFLLPTPTLLGLPLDEAGETAVQQQYAITIVTHALTHLAEYGCCEQLPAFQVLSALQLDALGIRPFPHDQSNYEAVFNNWKETTLSLMWSRSHRTNSQDRLQLATLLAYLQTKNPNITLADMLVALDGESQAASNWITLLVGDYDSEQFLSEWEAFVYDASGIGNIAQPLNPLPSDSLRMICQRDRLVTLHEYDFAQETWGTLFAESTDSFDSFYFMQNLQGKDMYRLELYQAAEGERTNTMYLWRNGEQFPLLTFAAASGAANIAHISEETSTIALFRTGSRQTPADLFEEQIIFYDLDSCTAEGCDEISRIVGPDIRGLRWSPNGRFATIAQLNETDTTLPPEWTFFDNALWLADPFGQPLRQIDSYSGQPVWIDDIHLGYLKIPQDETGALIFETSDRPRIVFMVTNIETGETYELITPEQLQEAAGVESPLVYPNFVVNASENGRYLLLYAPITSSSTASYDLFQLTLDLPDVTITRIPFTEDNGYQYGVYRDEWRAMLQRQNNFEIAIALENLQTGQSYQLKQFGNGFGTPWSSDNNWIISNRNAEQLMLLEPDSGYRLYIDNEFGECDTPHWVE